MFDAHETAFLASQRLARLATVATSGQPDCDAVGFEFDGTQFFIGGMALPRTRKYKNIAGGNRLVSLLIDDLASVDPWRPRGIKIHGRADIVTREGRFGGKEYFAITPIISWSWGLGGDDFRGGGFTPKKIVWTARERL